MTNNPLLSDFEVIPFHLIKTEHFLPAIKQGIALALAEVDAIVANPESPTFANTILALEHSGQTLSRVLGVFYPLLSADATDEMMNLSLTVSELMSDYSSRISLNEELFKRIKAVHSAGVPACDIDRRLLENTYRSFERSGANLQGTDRARFKEITARLSELTTRFGQNVKKQLAGISFPITSEQIANLPQWLIDQMAETAKAQGSFAPYALTLQAPEYMAFMRFSPFDDLRRRVYRIYNSRNQCDEFSNMEIIKEITALRLEKARMLGYDTFADFKLADTMAKTPAAALELLDKLRTAYMPAMRKEIDRLREFAGEEITPWNYAFHSNRLRKARYDFDPEEMRPYFELAKVTDGVFALAHRLYGITLHERTDIPVYHPDVKAFEVTDSDGSALGLLYTDFFPRPGRKSPGAWMTDFREADATHRPQVNIVMNFTKPGKDRPSLLTPDEVTTFLHEFGHALHSLLTRVPYASMAGTNVDRDFVELPSQFNENFFYSREFLDSFARHYQTGATLPQELYNRLIASRQFGAAYACIRQLNFGYLDFAFHTATHSVDVEKVETEALSQTEIFPHMPGTLIAPTFGHIFAGGYAAGYYSYKWAEVLDADAFAAVEANPSMVQAFRKNILEKGDSAPAAELYRAFRGHDAGIDALIKRDGI